MLTFFLSCHSQPTAQPDLIGEICRKVQKPTICNRALRTDPRSQGASLVTLGQIAVERSLVAAHATLEIAKSHESGRNTALAEVCIVTAGDSADLLNQCLSLLKSFESKAPITKSRIMDLQTYGSAALNDMTTCDDEYGTEQPANLQKATHHTKGLIDVALVIFNTLKPTVK